MLNKVEEQNIIASNSEQSAPQWAKFRKEILKSFPSPYRSERDSLADGIDKAIRELDKLKPEKAGSPAYLGTDASLTIDFENVKNLSLNPKMETSGNVIKQVIKLFELGTPTYNEQC
jgi:hypothetical protein